jgi:VanZ family protein
MTTIFIFSHQPADVSSEESGGLIYRVLNFIMSGFDSLSEASRVEMVESLQFVVRKCAHAFSYATLGGLLMGFMLTYDFKKIINGVAIAFGVALLYAVSDEVHQLFVQGRSGQVSDVVLDSVGAVCGICIVLLCMKLTRKRRLKKK